MSIPTEHKTVQAHILEYAQDIGWTFVSRNEAEQRRGFDLNVAIDACAKGCSLFFDDVPDAKMREFNPLYDKPKDARYSTNFTTCIPTFTATANLSVTCVTRASSLSGRRTESST